MKAFWVLLLGSLLSVPAPAEYRVALVLDKGGKDDKSFNSAAYAGSKKAEKELGIQLKYVEATDEASIETMIRRFAEKKFDLIIGIGFSMAESVRKVAAQNPDLKFALVDAAVDLPNVRSLLFEEQQGSYLVGAIAAMASKTGKIGFLGGMDVPLIRRFQMGFEAGVKKVNPKAKITVNYVGVTPDAWNNPPKAKELGLAQYNEGVDVIFAAAGASNYGLLDAAEEKQALAIGVDSNQDWVKPGYVLTSMLKRVDVAVFDAIKDGQAGKFTGGSRRFGLKNQGVDYSVDEFNAKVLTPEMRKRAEELKQQIIAGKISVPDYYSKHGK